LYAHSAKARVIESKPRVVDAGAEIVRIRFIERVIGTDGEFALGIVDAIAADAQNFMPAGERFLELE
jgi:hypothetical protein